MKGTYIKRSLRLAGAPPTTRRRARLPAAFAQLNPLYLLLDNETRRLIGWLPGKPGGRVAGPRGPKGAPRGESGGAWPPTAKLIWTLIVQIRKRAYTKGKLPLYSSLLRNRSLAPSDHSVLAAAVPRCRLAAARESDTAY